MRPDSAPIVTDHPVVLRPLDPSDAQAWFEFAGDPRVLQYTSSNVGTLEDLLPIIERANSAEPGSPIQFAVCSRDDGMLIGVAGYHTVSPMNRTAEITYTLRPSHWDRGIASAVCAALATWGFEEQKFVRIQATVLEPNLASLRVLQRCGFEFEGKLRNFRMVRGEPRDYLLYARVQRAAQDETSLPGTPVSMAALRLNPAEARVISAFHQAGARYIVMGGHAVHFHGHHRLPRDLDLLVEPTPDNMARLQRALHSLGYAVDAAIIEPLSKPAGQLELDGDPPLELRSSLRNASFAEAFAECARAQNEGISIPVLGRRTLLSLKRLLARPKDLEDIAALESAVSFEELRATVVRVEARLSASNTAATRALWQLYQRLVPRFEADLGASPRDVALAKASALMLVQAVAQSQAPADQGGP